MIEDTIISVCATIILIACFVLLIALGYALLLYYMKNYRKKEFGKFVWSFHCRFYKMEIELGNSTYHDYAPTGVGRYSHLGEYPCIDDPVMIEIANRLTEMAGNHSEAWKAEFALAFVQQNVKYVRDIEQYGESEYWALPIQVLCNRQGDCEDTAALYAGLAKLMGIQVRYFIVTSHAVPAIKEAQFKDKPLVLDDEKWYPCETTGFLYITGYYNLSRHIITSSDVIEPTDSFKSTLVRKY